MNHAIFNSACLRRNLVVAVSLGVLLLASPAFAETTTSTSEPATTTTSVPATTTTVPATTTTVAPSTTTTHDHVTTTSHHKVTTTTKSGEKSTSSSTLWLGILALVVLAVLGGTVAFFMANRRREQAAEAWTPPARAALESAILARDLLAAQPTGGDEALPRARAQAEDASVALDRTASAAPGDAQRAAAEAVATSLRGLSFAIEAENLMRTSPTPPSADQLAEADVVRRRRTGELDAALSQLRVATQPVAR